MSTLHYRSTRQVPRAALLLLCAFAPQVLAQQNDRALDLRTQIAPIFEEQMDAQRYRAITVVDGLTPPLFPIALTIESISPISQATRKALVVLAIRNTGAQPFRIPISRELKILHAADNQDRRTFTCSAHLHDATNEQLMLGSVATSSVVSHK
jgi:hypothetical protein